MNIMFGINVNLLAVLAVTVLNMIIGSLWYGPFFGKTWMRLSGMSKESTKKMQLTPGESILIGFFVAFITNYVLAIFLGLTGASTWSAGAMVGFWVWLGFAMPLQTGVFLWEGRSFHLFLFNTIQYLITILIAASILASL